MPELNILLGLVLLLVAVLAGLLCLSERADERTIEKRYCARQDYRGYEEGRRAEAMERNTVTALRPTACQRESRRLSTDFYPVFDPGAKKTRTESVSYLIPSADDSHRSDHVKSDSGNQGHCA
jgi:hypothetical protein